MKFTDIVEFSGKTCSTFDGKKNYISTGCVHDDHICKDEIETVEYINKPSRANLVVEPGDILFAKMQATKKTLLINEDLSQNIYSTGFYAVKPKDGLITKKCLFYLINSSLFLGEKDKNCSGATQKAINNQGLSSIELNIPEFSVQKLLTQKLDVLSKVIEVKRSQIRLFDNLIKARFVEMFDSSKTNPIRPLSDIAEYWNGLTYKPTDVSDGGTIVLRSSNIQNMQLDLDDIVRVKCDISNKKIVKKNDILMCSRNGSAKLVGKVALIPNLPEQMSFGAFMMIIRSEYYQYLMTYFQLPEFRSQISTGTTTINQITRYMLDKVKLPVPDKASIDEFFTFVTQVDKSKFAVQKSLEKTKLLFDSLMQEYFG